MRPDCGQDKPLAAFGDNADRPDGKAFYCRDCFSRRAPSPTGASASAWGSPCARRSTCRPATSTARAVAPRRRSRTSTVPQQSGGRASWCAACKTAKEKVRRLQKLYGLTPDQRARLVTEQGGLCAICRELPPEHVDHDHLSGRLRGCSASGATAASASSATARISSRGDRLPGDHDMAADGGLRASTRSLHRARQLVVRRLPRRRGPDLLPSRRELPAGRDRGAARHDDRRRHARDRRRHGRRPPRDDGQRHRPARHREGLPRRRLQLRRHRRHRRARGRDGPAVPGRARALREARGRDAVAWRARPTGCPR